MRLFFILSFAACLGFSNCGPILHSIREHLHAKVYGHGLHGDLGKSENSPIVNINNYQQASEAIVQQGGLVQQAPQIPFNGHQSAMGGIAGGIQSNIKQEINHNQYQQNQFNKHHGASSHLGVGDRGDYGSLTDSRFPSSSHADYGYMNSNTKAGGSKYQNTAAGFGGVGSGFGGVMNNGASIVDAGGIRTTQGLESYHRRQGPKFGYHHDNNMFGNAKRLQSSPLAGAVASSSASSTAASSSSLGSSSSSSSFSSSSTSFVNGLSPKPWCNHC